jgi:ribosomal protein S18 acetylase RimI-like enzyme
MESGVSIEILDLRHFSAPVLRAVLEAEGELWRQRLHWDYRVSARLLMQYLDSHMLPGFAALEAGQVAGYVFCVYEESKAIIGDVFALRNHGTAQARQLEETLLRHVLELLQNSPHVDRVESQLLLHPTGSHASIFREVGFDLYRRLFMVRKLEGIWSAPKPAVPAGLELRLWRDDDLPAAARLISEAYRDHPDSVINDQYRSIYGSLRFLNNIVRHSGCGEFVPQASSVLVVRKTGELAALVLGSRVSSESGHITQVCVHPSYRRQGLARMLLSLAAASFLRLGAREVSLTVTEANSQAVELYRSEGYDSTHVFDAAVWERGYSNSPQPAE